MKTIHAKRIDVKGVPYAKLELLSNKGDIEAYRQSPINYSEHEDMRSKIRDFAKFHEIKRYKTIYG